MAIFTNDVINITLKNYSQMIGTSPVLIFPQQNGISYYRIFNVAASNGGTIWLSRYLGASVAANTPGCYSLAPGAFEEFKSSDAIPINGIWAIATQSSTPLTVELG